MKDVLLTFMLIIPLIFLQSVNHHQPTNAFNKIQFMTSIYLLHVLAPGCQPQGVFQIKGIQAQHAKLGTASHAVPSLVCWACIPLI